MFAQELHNKKNAISFRFLFRMLFFISFVLVTISGEFVCNPSLNSSLVFEPSFYLALHVKIINKTVTNGHHVKESP